MSQYFDAALIQKYSQSGPRYTSYPTADRFHAGFTTEDYIQAVRNRPLVPAPR